MILLQRYASNPDDASRLFDGNEPLPTRLAIPSSKRLGCFTVVHYRVDERCAFVRLSGWWLYVATPVGLACYPELASLLANASFLGRLATLQRLEDLRLLAFLAFCELSDEVSFGRSLDGFGSLFFRDLPKSFIVSDSRFSVAKVGGAVKFSAHDETVWRTQATLDPEGSFLEGVKRCFAGIIYSKAAEERHPLDRRFMAPHGHYLSEAASIGVLHDGLMAEFATFGDRRIALSLSGGIDSRVILVGLVEATRKGILRKDQILCISILFPGMDCDESDEICQIARLSGFEWVGIRAATENVSRANSACLTLDAPPYSTNFMSALYISEAKKRGAEIVISGHGGDEIFDYDLHDLLGCAFRKRVRGASIIRSFRNPQGLFDEAKTLASVCLGRPVMRSTWKLMSDHESPWKSMCANRLGRRIALAQGCGYEISAHSAAKEGVFLGAPLLRGPFFDRFNPGVWTLELGDAFKPVAFAFIAKHAADISKINAKKVTFESAVSAHLLLRVPKCDAIDGKELREYAAKMAYDGWRSALSQRGVFET